MKEFNVYSFIGNLSHQYIKPIAACCDNLQYKFNLSYVSSMTELLPRLLAPTFIFINESRPIDDFQTYQSTLGMKAVTPLAVVFINIGPCFYSPCQEIIHLDQHHAISWETISEHTFYYTLKIYDQQMQRLFIKSKKFWQKKINKINKLQHQFENQLLDFFSSTDQCEVKKIFFNMNLFSLAQASTMKSSWVLSYKYFSKTNVDQHFSEMFDSDAVSEEETLQVIIASEIKNIFHAKTTSEQKKTELVHVEYLLSLVPFPLAIFKNNRELWWQNTAFVSLKILPSLVSALFSNAEICLQQRNFKVFHHEFSQPNHHRKDHLSIIFLQELIFNTMENNDIGIMTSSLAHEMNNPLTAIKSALEVLGLFNASLKQEEIWQQMMLAVDKCMTLVRIFLGFARQNIYDDQQLHHMGTLNSNFVSPLLSFKKCLDLSLQMMRSRLVTTKVKFLFEYQQNGIMPLINSNVVTILCYWLLNQIVTLVEKNYLIHSHHFNATSSGLVQENIKILMVEENKQFSIMLQTEWNSWLLESDFQSFLFFHLMTLELLTLKIFKNSLAMIKK